MSQFSLTLVAGGKTYTSEGVDVYDALKNLPKPAKTITKGRITVKSGEKAKEVHLTPAQMRRMFYPLAQKVIARNLAMCLK